MHAPISNLNKFLTQFSYCPSYTFSLYKHDKQPHCWVGFVTLKSAARSSGVSRHWSFSLLQQMRQEQRATNAEVPQLDWRDHGPREPCSSWFLSLLSRFCRCNWQWTWPATPLGTGTAALDTGQPRHQLDQRVGLSPAWSGAVALPVQTALSAVLHCQGLGRTVHGSTRDLWMERRAQLGQHVSSVAFVNVASLLVRCPKM